MTYIYDIILNFDNEFFEFYEWMKEDEIFHIKRIFLAKVNGKCYDDFLKKKIQVSDEFLLSLFHKCEYYDNRSTKTIPYAILLTDSYRVMAVILKSDGSVSKYSSLLLDEEEDVLSVSDKLATIKIDYKILSNKKDGENYLTRYEKNLIKYIKKDLNNCYKKKDLNKLEYLYYEYFNQKCHDLDLIYQKLLKELEKDLTEKHYSLYQLIKLSLR